MSLVTLNDGFAIPRLGLGTWRITRAEAPRAIVEAVEIGYRHFDTAHAYSNEVGVGQGIADCGLDRTELFVVTKLWPSEWHDPRAAFLKSLGKLGLDYLDLYLIHWPVPAQGQYFVQVWEELIKLREAGLARSIGVCNFLPEHLDAVVATGVRPAVNQIEVHPTHTNTALIAANADHGILTETYQPFGEGRDLAEPALQQLAERLELTVAQVILAWHLAKGYVTIPKSGNPARMRENFAAQEVRLDATDIATIDNLNADRRMCFDPATFAGVDA